MNLRALRAGFLALALLSIEIQQTAPGAGQAVQQPPAAGQQPPAAGQQPAPDQGQRPPIFRAGANLVRVDVIVTDHRGEPVTDLTRDEFEVSEDGVSQQIQSFELVRSTGEPTDDRSLEIRSPQHAAY